MKNSQPTYPNTNGGYIPLPRRPGAAPERQFLRLPDVLANYVPVSNATIWRWIKAGEFPQPIEIGSRVRVWDLNEVKQWIANKKAS